MDTSLTLLIAVTFCVGYALGVRSHVGDPVVSLEIVNRAREPIRTVIVKHEHGTAVAAGIDSGESKTLKFFAPGETSFRTTVDFASGLHLEGAENYAEAGYHITTTVKNNGIEHDLAPY
jgi:hypothetical protein